MFLRLLFKIIYHSSPHDQVNTMQLIVAVTLLIIIFSHAILLMCYHILNLYFLSIFCHNQLKSLTCIEHEDYCNNLARLNDKIYDFLETISRINICMQCSTILHLKLVKTETHIIDKGRIIFNPRINYRLFASPFLSFDDPQDPWTYPKGRTPFLKLC